MSIHLHLDSVKLILKETYNIDGKAFRPVQLGSRQLFQALPKGTQEPINAFYGNIHLNFVKLFHQNVLTQSPGFYGKWLAAYYNNDLVTIIADFNGPADVHITYENVLFDKIVALSTQTTAGVQYFDKLDALIFGTDYFDLVTAGAQPFARSGAFFFTGYQISKG